MTYKTESSLANFPFWSGAKYSSSLLTVAEFDIIESNLEGIFADSIPSDTDINDLFWFEFDTIAEWIGYESEDDFLAKRDTDEHKRAAYAAQRGC